METQQIKQIIKNMQEYATTNNNCEFKTHKYSNSELLNNQPQDLKNYHFIDNGFILSFNISFKEKFVYIEEDSENQNDTRQLTFKDFIKFQENFLNINYNEERKKTT